MLWLVLCVGGVQTTLNPFADQTSGGPQKYTGNFGACDDATTCQLTPPVPTDPFTITKSANPTSLPSGGGTVTW